MVLGALLWVLVTADSPATDAGVVVLEGSAPSRTVADSATELVEGLDGVVLVVDQVSVDKSLTKRLKSAWQQGLAQLRGAIGYLPLLAIAALILALSLLLARCARRSRWGSGWSAWSSRCSSSTPAS